MYKETFSVKNTHFMSSTVADVLCFDVPQPLSLTSVRFILVYRPPNSSNESDDNLLSLLSNLCSCTSRLVVLGDFNLNINWDTKQPSNRVSSNFLNFFEQCGLNQIVNKPSRGESFLDIILTCSPGWEISYLPPLHTSDHLIICFNTKDFSRRSHLPLPLPNFYRADYFSLNRYFTSVDWWTVFHNYSNIDELYKRFCSVV